MKKFKLATLAAFVFALIVGLNSCNKGEGPIEGEWDLFDAPEWLAPEADNTPVDVIGGDLEKPFDICPPEADIRMYDGNGNGKDKGFKGKRRFMPLGRILRELQLDDAQKEMLKDYLFDYRLCIQERVKSLRETERELLAPFNEQRKAIFEAYKNGDITREEAVTQLQALREQIREVMAENDYRQQACEAMKECRALLFESIRDSLTEEQQAKWDEWVAQLPEIDCDRERE